MDYNDEGCKYLIISEYNGEKTDSELCQLYNNGDLFRFRMQTNKNHTLLEIGETCANGIRIVFTEDGKYKVLKELEANNEYGEFHKCLLTAMSIMPTINNSTYSIITLEDGRMGVYDFSLEKFISPLFNNINFFDRVAEEIDKGIYETTTIVYDEESKYESEIISYIYGDGTFASPILDLSSGIYYDPNDKNFNYDDIVVTSKQLLNCTFRTRKQKALKLINDVK